MRLKIAVSAVRFRPWPPSFAHECRRRMPAVAVALSRVATRRWAVAAAERATDGRPTLFRPAKAHPCFLASYGFPARICEAYLPRPNCKSRELCRHIQCVGLRHLHVRLDTDHFPTLHRI